ALTIWGLFREAPPAIDGTPGVSRRPQHWSDTEQATASTAAQARAWGAPKIMLMNAWQDRLALHELVEKVAKTCNRFKVDRLLIESKASGISVAQEIRRLHSGYGWGVQLIDPGRQDKIARAYSVQGLFADGM